MKKLLFTLIFITALNFVQHAQAQETKEYVTVGVLTTWNSYIIAYPDGQTENGELGGALSNKNLKSNMTTLNGIFNMLAKKGYKLVSSNGGDVYLNYIFEK